MKNWLTDSFKEPTIWWALSWIVTLPCYVLFFWQGVQKRPGLRFAALLTSAAAWLIAYMEVAHWLPLHLVGESWWTAFIIGLGWPVGHIVATIIAAIVFCELRNER